MSLPGISTALLLVCVLLTGCNPSAPPAVSATSSARLSLSSLAALPADVARVTVTVSAADMTPMSSELVQTNGEYGGVISDLPAGANRTFLARAFTSSNTLRYEGRAEGITLTVGATTLVSITLIDVTGPPPFSNEAPVIESLVATPATVAPGGTVSLEASARDPNTGDSISYAWTASAGTFAASTQASTPWTAPATEGPVTLTMTVSDSRGASASQRLTVFVVLPTGAGEISVGFNAAPRVVTLTSTQSTLNVGRQTSLAVSATDAEGDSLSYQWAATCAGNFTGATTTSATFTPSALPTAACNNCQLSVTVKDGRGSQNTGSLALCVAKDLYLPPPSITRAYQSSTTAPPGQAVVFEVGASDPAAAALSFSWTATVGTLVAPSPIDASSSRVIWTPPACVSAGTTPSITATVRNTRNQKTTRSFTVTVPSTCVVAGWIPVGSMSNRRRMHTATLLQNGKVLVAGGYDSSSAYVTESAELYDPATGTWSRTGSMTVKRYSHTATLLPNGKVLVAGGYTSPYVLTSELYDPATGTWSPTFSHVIGRANHHAALLANGKVLIAGGSTYPEHTSELYEPATNTWSSSGHTAVNSRTEFASALLADGRMLLSGGVVSFASSAVELYDPATGTWNPTGSMGAVRYSHTAALLSSGKVLVAGGYDSGNSASRTTAELYDPATGTWNPTGSMADARTLHTATRLPSGKVLVAGGSKNGDSLPTVELYAPATGTWSATGSLVAPRHLHTATLLADGKVLVVGGYNGRLSLNSAEVYDPGP